MVNNITFRAVDNGYVNVILSQSAIANSDRIELYVDSIYLVSSLPEDASPTGGGLTKHRLRIKPPANANYTPFVGASGARKTYTVLAANVPGGAAVDQQAMGGKNTGAGDDDEDGLIRATTVTATTYTTKIGTYTRNATNIINSFGFFLDYWDGSAWVRVEQADISTTYLYGTGGVNYKYRFTIDTSVVSNIAYRRLGTEPTTINIVDHIYTTADGGLTGNLLNNPGGTTIFSAQDVTDGISYRIVVPDQTSIDNIYADDQVSVTIPALTLELTDGNALNLASALTLPAFRGTTFHLDLAYDWRSVLIKLFGISGVTEALSIDTTSFTTSTTNGSTGWTITASIIAGSPNQIRITMTLAKNSPTFVCSQFLIAPN